MIGTSGILAAILLQGVQPSSLDGGWRFLASFGENTLVPLGVFVFAGFVVWLKVRQRQAEAATAAELHKHLIGKFASGSELAAFLESSGGRQLLDSMASRDSGVKQRIIRNVMVGVLLSALGLGFLGLAGQKGHNFLIAAVILLALGAGYLISAAISYRLSRNMGLLRDGPAGPPSSLPSSM